MDCIYCRRDSGPEPGIAHIIPEALVRNNATLPRGAVCDECNHRLGQLDSALVGHPAISFAIQFFGLPGKRRRPRERIGPVSRQTNGRHWQLSSKATIEGIDSSTGGKRTARFTIAPEPSFDLLLFRRALHHVALNYLAAIRGTSFVLESQFDDVRRYVRRPHRGEAWYFGERDGMGEHVPRSASLRLLRPAPEYTIFQVFHREFLVDLYHRPGFTAVAESEGFAVIDPETERIPPVSLRYVED